MNWVVDASVVIKWFVPEEDQPAAYGLLQDENSLSAPDLLVAEMASIVWKKTVRKELASDQAHLIISGFPNSGIQLLPSLSLRERALEIALLLEHSAYDCFYIAAAERLDTPLVTADKRLLAAVRTTAFQDVVRPLAPS